MRRILTFCACATLFGTLAFGETLTGRLIDASCYDQQKSAATCDPTGSTAIFGILVSGKAYKLDDEGGKIADALKNRADRSSDPNKTSTQIMAKVTGDKDGNTIKVETVEVQ
jgi:hypothetical protein